MNAYAIMQGVGGFRPLPLPTCLPLDQLCDQLYECGNQVDQRRDECHLYDALVAALLHPFYGLSSFTLLMVLLSVFDLFDCKLFL